MQKSSNRQKQVRFYESILTINIGYAIIEVEASPEVDEVAADPKIRNIIIEHRDRLMRFGFEYIESALMA
ncbi:MAG TPA: hypothetical protein DCL69_05885, partial [Firmicutes bacterium]|nr:hypothetical protein [Bacillota bacterium]